MISKRLLQRLAANPSLPSRDSLLETVRWDDSWRCIRRAYQSLPSLSGVQLAKDPAILVFDCRGSESLPGDPISNPATSSDSSVKSAAVKTQELARFYNECCGRNSIDNRGGSILSSVHFSRAYSNAYWNGSEMVYGGGDGLMLLDFTQSDDFVGHELTHGVTQYTAGLGDVDEPGALNESVSDVFGSIFRQWVRFQTVDEADWQIGPDIMGPTARSQGWICLRDLSNPAACHSMTKQPIDYTHYIPGGDTHDNCGIPNRAFFLFATALGGRSWNLAGPIWYRALLDPQMNSRTNFQTFAKITLNAAATMTGGSSMAMTALASAWRTVEVLVES
jgi:Zn-dependent metalloprotease